MLALGFARTRPRKTVSLLCIASFSAVACTGGLGADPDASGTGGDGGSKAFGGGGAPPAAVGEGGSAGDGGHGLDAIIRVPRPPQPGPCPPDMALAGEFCIDRFEAPNIEGALPLVMESALSAEAWCEERDKRLCTEAEWVTACQGLDGNVYPYGDTYDPDRCNDGKTWIAPDEATLDTWPSDAAQVEVDALYQAEPSGSMPGCASSFGVYDLTGNVEEWVVRTEYHVNEYPHVLKGCYWSGCFGGAKPRCASTNPAHASAFRFYETGFRCCRDAE